MRIGIIGAGIGGLSSAYFLKNTFKDITVYEASNRIGGLAGSFKWHGFDCDIGPHRMFTDNTELQNELQALVPMHQLRRKSKIFIQGKWIRDPINIMDLLSKFFLWKSTEMVLTYLFRKNYPSDNFEHVVLRRFGTGLNRLFFKPYSEKLFGIPANQISATWAENKLRVGGLLALLRKKNKLYFSTFLYPKSGGYGAICDSIYKHISHFVKFDTVLTSIVALSDKRGYRCEFACQGRTFTEEFDIVITSLALPIIGKMLGIEMMLRLRPTRFVYLLLNKPQATDNHWFYFADKDFIINRVSEFKNFQGENLPADKTVICCEVTQLERFSLNGVIQELVSVGIVKESDIEDTLEINVNNAYPIYDLGYDLQIKQAKVFFSQHPMLFHVGRNADFSHKDTDEIFYDAKELAKTICRYA